MGPVVPFTAVFRPPLGPILPLHTVTTSQCEPTIPLADVTSPLCCQWESIVSLADITTPRCDTLLFVGCLTSQQHASVSQGRICSDKFTYCYTEVEASDQAVYLTQSQYTDTGPTSPSADPITPGAWQGSH